MPVTTRFIIGFSCLLLLQLLISPTTYAQQTLTISTSDTELTATLDPVKERSINNAYPGMTINFQPLTIKNTSPNNVNISFTLVDLQQELESLTFSSNGRKYQAFILPGNSSSQVQLQGKLKSSLGNDYQNQTLNVPVTFYLTADKETITENHLLPQTHANKLNPNLATLLGIVLVGSLIYTQQKK